MVRWIAIGATVWAGGLAAMLAYGVVSYGLLKRKLRGAAHDEANIRIAENIRTPFVLGILKPKIILPQGLPAQEHLTEGDRGKRTAELTTLCNDILESVVESKINSIDSVTGNYSDLLQLCEF